MSVQDLRLVGITDDGMHLLLAGPDGGRFHLPLDPALRSAVRHERPRPGAKPSEPVATSPRQVQALIRAGASADEVAEVTGWSRDKIARYEGPIIAEREHVAGLATGVRLRGGSAGASLLGARVAERLAERGVDPTTASWDAWRVAGSPWTLALTFAAGGRLREAAWHFDLGTREVDPVDDEARWLTGDDEPHAPEPLVPLSGPRRVYDVETEGGVHSPGFERESDPIEPLAGEGRQRRQHDTDDDHDLVASVRERSKARRRSRGVPRPRRGQTAQEALPGTDAATPAAPTAPASAAGRASGPAVSGPVSEIDAVVESIAPTPTDTSPDAQVDADLLPAADEQAPPLPQGGPVSDVALAPAEDTAVHADMPAEVPHADSPAGSLPVAPGEDDSPAVEVERTTSREVPVSPTPHPRVSGQVEFPGMEADADRPTAAEVVAADETEAAPSEGAALADRTSGTDSRAADVDESATPSSHGQADAPAKAKSQRRTSQARKGGRPSVPSWDDIMFGAKKDD